jgi:hypothetical protein
MTYHQRRHYGRRSVIKDGCDVMGLRSAGETLSLEEEKILFGTKYSKQQDKPESEIEKKVSGN